MPINLTINRVPVTVPEGTTILDAAKEAGIKIPTLCHLEGVASPGSCRVCLVEVQGARTLQPSCVTKVGFREFDILIVGKLLGFADVSLYKLAKKFCAALDRLTNPLFQSLYPELTKLWAKKDFKDFRFVVKRMTYLMGGLSLITWIVFVIWGRGIIFITTGREFIPAYPVTVWYMLANAIAVTSLPLAPMILAMGQAQLSFWIQFLPTLIYFPVLFWMLSAWGLSGAGYAYIVFHGLRVTLQYGFAKHLLKKTPRGSPSPLELIDLPENDV